MTVYTRVTWKVKYRLYFTRSKIFILFIVYKIFIVFVYTYTRYVDVFMKKNGYSFDEDFLSQLISKLTYFIQFKYKL